MGEPGYIAFSWRGAEEAAARWRAGLQAQGSWARAFFREELEVWVRGERPPLVESRSAGQIVTVGRCFAKPGAVWRETATDPVAAARKLSEDAWGVYVALLQDGAGNHLAFRDPIGGLDALVWSVGPITAIASDVTELPAALLPAGLAPDWDVVGGWLLRPLLASETCGLLGVETLPAGALRPLRPGSVSRRIWRAADTLKPTLRSDAELELRLRETLRAVAGRWAEAAGPALLEVSGGFDSSLVASVWPRDRVQASFNLHAARREADERTWAVQVADLVGAPFLAVEKTSPPFQQLDFLEVARGARPALNALDVERDRITAALARKHGAAAIIGGQGGDPLFFQMPSAAVLRDYTLARGPLAGYGGFGAQVARRLRSSLWRALGESRATAVSRPSALLGPRARNVEAPELAWLEGAEGAPPGKRQQLESLAATFAAFGRSRRGAAAELVHPLLSQPFVELALSIPTWRLMRDGRERGMARDAFSPWLPRGVVERQSKGALTSVYARQTAASLEALRALLLDGVLVGAGLLDPAALDEALMAETLIWRGDPGGLLVRAAAIEAWARAWGGRSAPG